MNRQQTLDYLAESLRGFVLDPPDSDFNSGYLAALKETYKVIAGEDAEDALLRAVDKVEE
jgi:hypothetical protein